MSKKIFALAVFLFAIVLSAIYDANAFSSSASSFDVSIDRVKVNGNAVAESKTNLINDADIFSVVVDFTAVATLEKGHVEAVLRGRQSGDAVSDSTGTFDAAKNQSSAAAMTLVLIDSLKRETEFDLTIKVIDAKSRSEQKSYGIKTQKTRARGALDVSIDRIRVNDRIVAPSRTNFIEKSNDFDVAVEFTALEDMEDARIESVLKDLKSGTVVADSSPNFDLGDGSSSLKLLRLELLDKLKQSNSFELTVRIADSEGDSLQQVYGLRMRDGSFSGSGGRVLDVSIDSIEVESNVVAANESNFIIIGEGKKELDLRIRLTSLEDVEDAHIDAVLAFENGDVVADATTTFDISDGENTIKKLELPLIGDFEQSSFMLKIKVVDAEGDFEEKFYRLKVSKGKFPFVISSILLSPESNIEAGKNLVARLNFKNSGVVPLEGINAKVSIPELGISSAKFVDQIKNSRLPELREDFILKILDNTPTGTYTLVSEISPQFGSGSEVKKIPVFIIGKNDQARQTFSDRLVITAPVTSQDIKNDGTEVIYPLILKNEGPNANTYTLLLDGAGWASLRLSEPNVLILNPKESKTMNVYASSMAGAGEHLFLVTIKSGDKALKQIPLKGNIIAEKGGLASKLKNILELVLIGFVVFLAAMGIFFGIRHMGGGSREKKEAMEELPDKAEGESYY